MKAYVVSVVSICLLSLFGVSATYGFNTKAKQAFLIEAQTGKVLLEKNPDEPMYPSSMTKIMTILMVFDQLKKGKVALEDGLSVSEEAWRKGGSKMFLQIDTSVKVEDLIRGIIVQSGNDASIVIAEGLSGSEETFAAEMTARAKEIGTTSTNFKNSTGWPDPEHVTTARDLALIANTIITEFPDLYQTYFGEKEFTYNKIRQPNRNSLLFKNLGADGLKTGQTDAGGFGIVGSAVQNGQRLIVVINGLTSARERTREAEALLRWGFRNFVTVKAAKAGEIIGHSNVWLGSKPEVALTVDKDLYVTVARRHSKELDVEIKYSEPIAAPIKSGQTVGKLLIRAPEIEEIVVPLKAAHKVKRANFLVTIPRAVYYLFWGHNEKG